MCGILGIIKDKKFVRVLKKLPLRSLIHRGPDFQDSVSRENFYFGHTRLSIIGLDERSAKQPIFKKIKF